MFEPDAIYEGVNNEWQLFVDTGDGLKLIPNVLRALGRNEKRDIDVPFGVSPNSTDTFKYTQWWRRGAGGAGTILWTRDKMGNLFGGGLGQMRVFIDPNDPIFNVMRGMYRVNQDRLNEVIREVIEETGRTDLLTPVKLPGASVCMDSAWFQDGLVDFYGLEVPYEALVPDGDVLRFDKNELTEEQLKEAIYGVSFEPDDGRFEESADAFTIIAHSRLKLYLQRLASQGG